jgi:hypothetical protein
MTTTRTPTEEGSSMTRSTRLLLALVSNMGWIYVIGMLILAWLSWHGYFPSDGCHAQHNGGRDYTIDCE